MMDDVHQILFDARAIAGKVKEIAARISADYAGRELVLICILKGGAVFTADLMRQLITLSVTVEFVQVTSYGDSTTSSKQIVVMNDEELDISGRHVLLVDTIVDTGTTMDYLFKKFGSRHPATLKAAALLDKKSRRTADITISYIGFEIPDKFVVGYGMDQGGKYRNLPYIAALKPDAE